jgi:hypothetical protein
MNQSTDPADGRGSRDSALWNQLQNAVAFVAKEDQIIWTIFGIFWAANALLLAALFVQGKVPDRTVGIVISAAGAVLSLIWAVIQSRALRFLHFYEKVQEALEAQLLTDGYRVYTLSRGLNQETFDKSRGTRVPARIIMRGSSVGCAVAWVLSTVGFLCR